MVLAAHSIAEMYAVLTRLPLSPRIGPAVARELVEQNAIGAAEHITELPADGCTNLPSWCAARGIAGGATYDAIAVLAAEAAGADKILTLNTRDFARLWPDRSNDIIEP